jgi:prophage antirepressor-like protein
MNNQMIPFSFENKKVRMTLIDGQEWWVGKDVCDALGHSNNRKAITRLEDYEKLTYPLVTSGQTRQVWLVNESGVYSLALTSRTDKAKSFKKWLTTEILPQIRKTGGYGGNAEAFLILQYQEEENKRLREECEKQRREIRRYETRMFLTAGDKIDILTLRVQEYPVSAIQKLTKKGRKRIKDFLDEFFSLSEEEGAAKLKAWYEAAEGKRGAE